MCACVVCVCVRVSERPQEPLPAFQEGMEKTKTSPQGQLEKVNVRRVVVEPGTGKGMYKISKKDSKNRAW